MINIYSMVGWGWKNMERDNFPSVYIKKKKYELRGEIRGENNFYYYRFNYLSIHKLFCTNKNYHTDFSFS